jgi:hypothetical protein
MATMGPAFPLNNDEMTMAALSVAQATEEIYKSLLNDNEDIDTHIDNLKTAMKAEGLNEATFQTARLAQNNRQGRKMMEAYFRKRGVSIAFKS